MNEFIISTDILSEFELIHTFDYKIRAIILKPENCFFDADIMGLESIKYVENALQKYEITQVECKRNSVITDVILPYIKDEDYVIVLYANTPLITENTVLDAIDYATTKQLDCCKLFYGVIFKVAALKNQKFENTAQADFLSKEDFFAIFDYNSLSSARDKMKKRIIDKHLKNNVDFLDAQSCYIDFQVVIKSGVKIYANNVIKSNSVIEENCVLFENNVIDNSHIGKNCTLISSFVKNKKLKDNTSLKPFTVYDGEKK